MLEQPAAASLILKQHWLPDGQAAGAMKELQFWGSTELGLRTLLPSTT